MSDLVLLACLVVGMVTVFGVALIVEGHFRVRRFDREMAAQKRHIERLEKMHRLGEAQGPTGATGPAGTGLGPTGPTGPVGGPR